MVEQVYDPVSGKARDAFEGEIVPPEQEKTLQRLMREDAEGFRNRYGSIVDQLTPEQQDAIAAAEALLQERARKEYLEAVRQNPAIIIQGILKTFDPASPVIKNALKSLDNTVDSLQKFVAEQKVFDQAKKIEPETTRYAKLFVSNNQQKDTLIRVPPESFSGNVEQQLFQGSIALQLFKKLGLLPVESPDDFDTLRRVILDARNTEDSGEPYVGPAGTAITGFRSNKPGLEGVGATVYYRQPVDVNSINNETPLSIYIIGTPQVFARITDRGQYVPYGGKK